MAICGRHAMEGASKLGTAACYCKNAAGCGLRARLNYALPVLDVTP